MFSCGQFDRNQKHAQTHGYRPHEGSDRFGQVRAMMKLTLVSSLLTVPSDE